MLGKPVTYHISIFQMYENFVEEIDAIDNGVSQFDGEQRYNVTTTLSSRIGHLNPRWNEPDQDTEVITLPWGHLYGAVKNYSHLRHLWLIHRINV